MGLFLGIIITVQFLSKPLFFYYSRYCPAGCRDIAGDISGNIGEGYRDVSIQDNEGKIIKKEKKGESIAQLHSATWFQFLLLGVCQ